MQQTGGGAGCWGLTLLTVEYPQERSRSAFVTRQENHRQLERPHTQNQPACETEQEASGLEQHHIWVEQETLRRFSEHGSVVCTRLETRSLNQYSMCDCLGEQLSSAKSFSVNETIFIWRCGWRKEPPGKEYQKEMFSVGKKNQSQMMLFMSCV